MNDHLISRSRFLDAIVLDADNKTDLIQVHQALEKAVISPDDVRGVGEWIPLDYTDEAYGNVYKCAKCGCSEIGEPNYCSNCGAKMKGAEDEL